MIVTKVIGDIRETDIGQRQIERIFLSHEEMQKPHQKVCTQHGQTIKVSLDRGEALCNGAILLMDEKMVIVVDLIEEKVFEIKPKTNIEWAKAAFNIGNMHQRAYLYDDFIRVPYDPVLERMIDGLGFEYSIENRKLDGILANVSLESGGHSHHGHSHQHGEHHG